LNDPVRRALDEAARRDATAADARLVDQERLSIEVVAGDVDKLTRAHDRVLSVRVFRGDRVAAVSSSDISAEGIRELVERARDLADVAAPDPCVGLPEETAEADTVLDTYCERTAHLDPEEAVSWARSADGAARGADSRIRPIGWGRLAVSTQTVCLGRSDGFEGSYRSTSAVGSCMALAEDAGEKQRGAVYRTAHGLDALPSPESVGRDAAERGVGRLGARKIATVRAPVLYEPRTAVTLVQHLAEAASGAAIDQGRSCLIDRIGDPVGAPRLELVDDGRLPQGLGSRPFDGEGVATRRTPVVEKGSLRSYLLDSYTARRLGLGTTGNAGRGLRGAPAPAPSNLFIEPGEEDAASILARTDRGLLVTDLLGFGFNPVTGDYSRGVSGLWIEDGRVQYPVQEITVAGNLLDMLEGIDAIGNDLSFFGSLGAPTLRFAELTIAGS
jgi:PmbA protein